MEVGLSVKIGILATHPIQYQAPLFRELAKSVDLRVYFSYKATPQDQSKAGFGHEFEWDVDLLAGYQQKFLVNQSKNPGLGDFWGCDNSGIYNEIKKEAFDLFITFGWNYKSYWQSIIACKRLGIPIAVRGDSHLNTRRSWFKRLCKRALFPMMFLFFDGFLSVGKRNKEYLMSYAVPQHKIFFCPHCVDNDWFLTELNPAKSERAALRGEIGLIDGVPTLLFVGKLIKKKRVMDIINAMSICADKSVNLQCLVVGSGPQMNEISDHAMKANLKVKFVGFKNYSEIKKMYQLSDMLILPSDGGETWGLVVNEAMASGILSIVSDQVGCGPDLIIENKTGFIYPCGNISALAHSIQRALPLIDSDICKSEIKRKIEMHSIGSAVTSILNMSNTLNHRRMKRDKRVMHEH